MNRLSIGTVLGPALEALPVRQHRQEMAADTLQGLWRRRWLILGVTLLTFLIAVGALTVLERTYRSEAVIRLDFSKREGGVGQEQAPAVTLEAAALAQGEVRIIQSRDFARQVVERLGLANDPRFAVEAPSLLSRLLAPDGRIANALRSIGISDELLAQIRPPETNPEALRMERAIRDVMSRLSVAAENRSYLITIGYSSTDPERAARIANAFAEEYVQRRIRTNAEINSASSNWLAGQIREAQTALRELEGSIATFRQQAGISGSVSADGRAGLEGVAQQRLRELISQANGASLTRMNEEQRLARIQEAVRNNTIPSSADLRASPVISTLLEREASAQREVGALRTRLGDRHPTALEAQAGLSEIRSRLLTEVRRAVPIAAAEVEAARQVEKELKARVASQEAAVIAARGNESILRDRETQAQEIRDRIALLTRNSDQLKAIRDLPSVPASLIVKAEPEPRPSQPKPLMVLGAGGGGGLMLGLLLALGLERRDQGLRTRADITPDMDVRCLAMLPELPRKAAAAVATGVMPPGWRAAAFGEAVYLAGASIGLFNDVAACRIVLVTSALPREGRSLFCAALGRLLAKAGRRVLIVDALPPRRSDAEPEPRPVLPVVAAGEPPAFIRYQVTAGAETGGFRTSAFSALIEEASRRFDVILLEGAPVMLLADTLVLSHHADTVLLLARWAETKRRIVTEALRRLREHSVAVDGLILTRVNLRRHAQLRFFDECAFYAQERRFYEALSGRGTMLSSITGPRS